MALNDDAVLTAAVGYVYIANVGTDHPDPDDLSSLTLTNTSGWTPSAWSVIGHTSRNDLPEFGYDGGDSEVKGTWQKKKLREVVTDDPVDFLTIFLQQFDQQALELYYGENATGTPGVFGVSATASDPIESALFMVIEDGDFRIGFHAHKASIRRDDSIQLSADEFGSLPVRATFLQHESELLFSWINPLLFND